MGTCSRWCRYEALLQGIARGCRAWCRAFLLAGVSVVHHQPFLNARHCCVSAGLAAEHPCEAGSFHQPPSAIGALGPEE